MTEDPTPQELVAALQKAYDLQLCKGVMHYEVEGKEKFSVQPQRQEGKSFWAELLRRGKIQPFDALWACRGQNHMTWFALRVQWKGNSYLFNLQNKDDQRALRRLEERIKKGCGMA
jgi:hypothetical protein